MTRLFDQTLRRGFFIKDTCPTPLAQLEWLRDMRDGLPPCISIQNVADFYFSELWKNNRNWRMSDFPNLAPPWPACWMEFAPKPEHHPHDPPNHVRPKSIGVFFRATDFGEFGGLRLLFQGVDAPEDARFGDYVALPPGAAPHAGVARWKVQTAIFMPDIDKGDAWAVAGYHFFVGADGAYLRPPGEYLNALTGERSDSRHPIISELYEGGFSDEEHRLRITNFALNCFYPALLALTFIHAQGVKVQPDLRTIQAKTAALGRSRKPRAVKAVARYQVLEIGPIVTALRREMETDGVSLPQALHNVRGHWARYGVDGKGLLFGKYKRDVWVPNHERGTRRAGVTLNDFEVNTGQEAHGGDAQ